jgi:hypothetical protein
MKIRVKKRYYKRSQRGREPIKYHASQPRGIGTDIQATIKIDPVLKRHKDLRKSLLKHEMDEIREWGRGRRAGHTKARKREPKKIRTIGGVSGFWKEIERREGR